MKGKKSSMKRPPLNVAIFIFDGVEELDFCGPFEVFCLASRLDETAPFKVFTVSKDSRAVETRSGLSVNPHYSLTHCPKPDILLVPGGRGTRRGGSGRPVRRRAVVGSSGSGAPIGLGHEEPPPARGPAPRKPRGSHDLG